MTWKINRNKYGAKITRRDGYTFQSKAEADRYTELKMLQEGGMISELKIHPPYKIVVNGMTVCTAVLDFQYWDRARGLFVFEDVKGKDNQLSQLKRKLLIATFGIDVVIIRGPDKRRDARSFSRNWRRSRTGAGSSRSPD